MTHLPRQSSKRVRRSLRRLAAGFISVAVVGGSVLADVPSAQATTAATGSAKAVFDLINAERHAHHLRALKWSVRLTNTSKAHDLAMARYNTLSHQLPHEPDLGTRITRSTFPWRSAGENIGWNSVRTTAGATALERTMYLEKAPNNGHRLNILNTGYTFVGVYVYVDNKHHKLWLTTDFAGTF